MFNLINGISRDFLFYILRANFISKADHSSTIVLITFLPLCSVNIVQHVKKRTFKISFYLIHG